MRSQEFKFQYRAISRDVNEGELWEAIEEEIWVRAKTVEGARERAMTKAYRNAAAAFFPTTDQSIHVSDLRCLTTGDAPLMPEYEEADDPNNPPCSDPTGHKWNDDDYCSRCGADGRA